MRSQPLPGEASRRRAEEQFKTTMKVNSETKANTPSRQAEAAKTARLRALRLAKEAADKDTANRGAAAARPGDLSGAGAFEDLRPQPQNPSKLGSESFKTVAVCSGRHRHGPNRRMLVDRTALCPHQEGTLMPICR